MLALNLMGKLCSESQVSFLEFFIFVVLFISPLKTRQWQYEGILFFHCIRNQNYNGGVNVDAL